MAPGPGAGGQPAALTQLPRALTAAESSVRDASNAFSFALWGTVNAAQPGTNVFISPLSASFALGMTMNGAATTTYDQMHAALPFGSSSLGDTDAGVLPSFVDATRTYFGATVQGLNFADAAGSLATINGWVSNATNGKIPSVLDAIDPSEMMFLINAIYFKGSWRSKFDATQTTPATFTSSASGAQPMQLMHQAGPLSYAETATYQAVDLSYGDSAFSMTVLLPKAGTDIEALAASLAPSAWQTIVGGLTATERVDLSLPKLTLTYERTLNHDLMSLGMVEPFNSNGADFTRMAANPIGSQLYIDFVKQNSFLAIDEEGTEARR